jgi:hypothetical protein
LYSLDFSPATILTAFSCTRSRFSLSPTAQGDQAGEENSYEEPISAKTPENPPHCHVPLRTNFINFEQKFG